MGKLKKKYFDMVGYLFIMNNCIDLCSSGIPDTDNSPCPSRLLHYENTKIFEWFFLVNLKISLTI